MKRCLLVLCSLMGVLGWAMPTPEAIRKVQPLVAELMADGVAAFEKGNKTAVEVGEAALGYAEKAETEAAKFVLFKGALQYFVRGKDYDKAAGAVEALCGNVKDVPLEEVVNLIRTAAKGVRGKDAPQLLAMLKAAQQQIQARKNVAEAKRRLKLKPTDTVARRSLAEWLAVCGDWEAALEAFVACGGKEKKNAEIEAEGKELVDAADFWWAYEPVEVPSDEAFKTHAANLYRSCIVDGTLSGLRKELIEKRLQQFVSPQSLPPSLSLARSSSPRILDPLKLDVVTNDVNSLLYLCVDLSGGPNAKNYPVTYLSEPPQGGWTDEYRLSRLVLRRIPAGVFRMQKSYDMTISRDFYLGVFELTQKQWELVTGKNPSKIQKDVYPVEMVSYNDIRGNGKGCRWPLSADVDPESFMGLLRTRTGLTFDLPTSTQWEYACRAGMSQDFLWWGLGGYGRDYAFSRYNSDGHEHPVGHLKPNRWGLYDMNGNVTEWCLDWQGGVESGVDFKGDKSGKQRVLRGGSFVDGWSTLSVYCKTARPPSYTGHALGFRIALTKQPEHK